MLGLNEIGLHHAVTGWIEKNNTGHLWVIKKVQTQPNPFTPPTTTYEAVVKTVSVAVDQLSSEHTRRLFGSAESTYYSASIPLSDSLLTGVRAGLFAVVDYAGLQTIRGVIERIDRELDGSAVIYINTSEAVPNGVLSKAV